MTTATKAKAESTTFEERLARAELLHPPRAFERREQRLRLAVKAADGDKDALLQLADSLMVDPRWLATGRRSQASFIATRALYFYGSSYAVVKDATKPELARLDALTSFFEMLPEIDGCPGVCRYCGYTDYREGPGEWINATCHTICSTCLSEERG